MDAGQRLRRRSEQKGVKLLEDAHAKGTEIQIKAAVGHG
jgi:hypothetical protein